MHPLLQELHNEHLTISIKLADIERAISTPLQLKPFALKVILDLSELLNSSDLIHHYNEELIRTALFNSQAPIHPRVNDIHCDHLSFQRMPSVLEEKQLLLSSNEIQALIKELILQYYDHMDGEENIFFPQADRWQNDDQWSSISGQWHTEDADRKNYNKTFQASRS